MDDYMVPNAGVPLLDMNNDITMRGASHASPAHTAETTEQHSPNFDELKKVMDSGFSFGPTAPVDNMHYPGMVTLIISSHFL